MCTWNAATPIVAQGADGIHILKVEAAETAEVGFSREDTATTAKPRSLNLPPKLPMRCLCVAYVLPMCCLCVACALLGISSEIVFFRLVY